MSIDNKIKIEIPYGKQFISEEDIEEVVHALKDPLLTQGPKISEFEVKFAKYVGSEYAVALSNGTAALHLCALALGVDNKANVITTPITFAASGNCIRYCGGQVYFCDIHPDSYTLDPAKVRDLIASKPKGFFNGIIPVDLAGFPVNTEEFRRIADEHGLWIVEDACHAPGASFSNSAGKIVRSGSGEYADLSVFSFHPVKHIACGEGGMITTNNEELYKKLLLLRTHGITKDVTKLKSNDGGWYYEMHELGYNYRLTDFQAALGISQLKRAEAGLEARRRIARKYNDAFNNLPQVISQSGYHAGHAYHLYVIQVENRKGLYDHLRTKGVFCQVHYIPLHKMPYYLSFESTAKNLPHAEKYYDNCLSLPMYPTLTEIEQDYVISEIKKFFSNA